MWGFGKKDDDVAVKEPAYDVELPKIKVNITPEAHKKMFEYIHSIDGEISGMGLVRQDSDEEFTVYDVFILEQEAGAAYTSLEPKAIAKKIYELHKKGQYKDLSVWWHSHAGFDTFWSGTDSDTCNRLANNKILVSIVANKKQEVRCRVDLYKPLRITIDDVEVSMPEGKVAASGHAKAEIKALVTPVVYQYAGVGGFEVRDVPVDDPYLFKGTRISRKGSSNNKPEWWGGWSGSEGRIKEDRGEKASSLKYSRVEVEPGSYKTTEYNWKNHQYVDKNYQPLADKATGTVMMESKHSIVVSVDGLLLRVPKERFKVIEDEAWAG